MEIVGKPIFLIKHYWLRYEFAPGRGQIHAHMLLIMDNLEIQQKYHDIKTSTTTSNNQNGYPAASFLHLWMQQQFGMVSSLPNNLQDNIKITKQTHPCRQRLEDVDDITEDAARLLLSCQNHVCTDYCMRKRCFW